MEAEEFYSNSKQADGLRVKVAGEQLVQNIDGELAQLVRLEALWGLELGATSCLPCRSVGFP